MPDSTPNRRPPTPPTATWNKTLGRLWREYQWPVLLSLEGILFAAGYVGFTKHTAALGETPSALDLVYLTLQLITMESGAVIGPVSWELEVARYLLPAVTAYTALAAFAVVFRKQIQTLKLWFIHDHAIICGLGRKGFSLAQDLIAHGRKPVVIEQDESNDRIELSRGRGIIVVVGDATDSEVLRRAGIQKARWLISTCGDDGTNAEVAVRARALSSTRKRSTLTCIIHIVDPQLCVLLREREFATEQNPALRLELFNVFDRGARILLQEYPPFSKAILARGAPHLLLVGLGGLGESLVLHAARDWKDLRAPPGHRLRITIVDREADWKTSSLQARYPSLNQVCQLAPLQMCIRSPEFWRGEFLRDAQGQCDVDVAYVCLDNDSLGLHTGLVLMQHMRQCEVPIIIRMDRDAGLATLLRGEHDSEDAFGNLHAFALLDRTCTAGVVVGGTHEILARAAHEEYVRQQRQLGRTRETNPVLVPWKELPESVKESNQRQVDHIGLKLKGVGYGIAPLTDWDAASFTFRAEEVERMAEMEHERWSEELRGDGWTHRSGPKDPEKKTHPALVSWRALPESDRETNRAVVRELPAFLAQAGLQVYQPK